MFPTKTLLVFVFAAITGSALANPVDAAHGNPIVSLAIARRMQAIGGKGIVSADQARAKNLISSALAGLGLDVVDRRQESFPITNGAVTYTANVGVGSPPTTYSLILDTGSSNTWIGANKAYVKTSTSKSTNNTVSVGYGSGHMTGTEYTDTVTLSSKLVIANQSIGVASSSEGFKDTDGILGVGPVGLTAGTVTGTNNVPTVSDNLKKSGKISSEVLGVFFAPTTKESSVNGELSFGGVNNAKTTGAVKYTSLTSTAPAKKYWGVDLSLKYGSTSILSGNAGIVDTGTTLILLATDAFEKYKNATGAVMDETTGLLRITQAQYSALKPLNFVIGGVTYPLSPNGQIFPRSLNSFLGGDARSIYLIVSDLQSPSGQGLDFIQGYTFLERYYSVYDTTNSRVGFAPTAYTSATTN